MNAFSPQGSLLQGSALQHQTSLKATTENRQTRKAAKVHFTQKTLLRASHILTLLLVSIATPSSGFSFLHSQLKQSSLFYSKKFTILTIVLAIFCRYNTTVTVSLGIF